MSVESQTYTARWIFPVDGPPLSQGTITLHGDTIRAVEAEEVRRADVDLGSVAILPGFVNAHTHLDLSGARGLCLPTPDFTRWLRQVIAFRSTRTPAQIQADIAVGLAECLRYGTTLIGDISYGGASWELLTRAACRSVMFLELLGLTEERAWQSWHSAQTWLQTHGATDCTHAGLTPHAPYSVRAALYRTIAHQTMPIATHLAETSAELELLRDQRGPFVDFLKEMNVWDPHGLITDPADVLRLFSEGILIHGNYLDPQTPFTPRQTLVVCPRTHAAFGHSRHPFPTLLQRGMRIALGTDSLASNPDLDLLAEARCLRSHYPEVAPAALLRMLTLSGAEALRWQHQTGSLTPGKSADLVVVPLPSEEKADPYDLVLESTAQVQAVMFRGQWTWKKDA